VKIRRSGAAFRERPRFTAPTSGPRARPKATILVVEDDPALRSFYRSVLALAGYAVVAVDDGIGALRYLDGDQPTLVVLDLGLPLLSGQDVAREIAAHAETAQIPIVVVTGQSEHLNTKDFACVLRKPVDVDDLLSAIRRCLRGGR
jgi:two-component system KDP operon response regulator KdpE